MNLLVGILNARNPARIAGIRLFHLRRKVFQICQIEKPEAELLRLRAENKKLRDEFKADVKVMKAHA
jgi:hypothetical protein